MITKLTDDKEASPFEEGEKTVLGFSREGSFCNNFYKDLFSKI